MTDKKVLKNVLSLFFFCKVKQRYNYAKETFKKKNVMYEFGSFKIDLL